MKIINELNRRGFRVGEFSQKKEIVGFSVNGGRESTELFLKNIDSSLSRKRLDNLSQQV
jgi:hypothetical protein